MTNLARASVCALALIGANALDAQQPPAPAIRAVSTPTAVTASPMQSIDDVREIANGRVLVNSSQDHRLVVFDASLSHAVVVADTVRAGAAVYPRFGKLIPYLADSTLFLEADSRSLVLIDPNGTLGKVIALPRPQDVNLLTSGGATGTDSRGNLVYQGQRHLRFPAQCRPVSADAPARPPAPPPSDSIAIFRASFDTRTADTIVQARTIDDNSFPIAVYDANCKILSASVKINPSVPSTDAWTVTSRGSVAIVRGHDYHVDFIDADGSRRSGPKLPFDWRRLTDADKQHRVDSARTLIESVTVRGGYRMRTCGGSMSFSTQPSATNDATGANGSNDVSIVSGSRGGGGGGGTSVSASGSPGDAPRPPACQTAIVTPDFVPLDQMADYLAPIREHGVQADRDGNVWLLPTTSLSAKGGLLYDVVGPTGEMVERVQLPADRDIAGFGRNGVLYLSHRVSNDETFIEKAKILR